MKKVKKKNEPAKSVFANLLEQKKQSQQGDGTVQGSMGSQFGSNKPNSFKPTIQKGRRGDR